VFAKEKGGRGAWGFPAPLWGGARRLLSHLGERLDIIGALRPGRCLGPPVGWQAGPQGARESEFDFARDGADVIALHGGPPFSPAS
jgi:hypothetical protein